MWTAAHSAAVWNRRCVCVEKMLGHLFAALFAAWDVGLMDNPPMNFTFTQVS